MIVSPPLLSSWEVCNVLRACECCYKQPILISDSEWLLSKVVALSTHITCWQVHQWNFGWLWSIPFSIKINLRMLFPFLIRVSTVMWRFRQVWTNKMLEVKNRIIKWGVLCNETEQKKVLFVAYPLLTAWHDIFCSKTFRR